MKQFKACCVFQFCNLPIRKVKTAKDLGKNYINVRPPLVRHPQRNRLFHCKSVMMFNHVRCLWHILFAVLCVDLSENKENTEEYPLC